MTGLDNIFKNSLFVSRRDGNEAVKKQEDKFKVLTIPTVLRPSDSHTAPRLRKSVMKLKSFGTELEGPPG
jgi:hypothetical protein